MFNYNPYQPNPVVPQYQYPNQQFGQPQMQRCEVTRVNGRNGAEAFRMSPNSSILLMDENDPIVWLKVTDGAGYATVTPYSIAPYQPTPAVDVASLESRIARLEEILNGKPNESDVKPKSK